MQNNKLFSLLQTFSGHELIQFRKYLLSPFFNEHPELVKLFDAARENGFVLNKTGKKDNKLGLWEKIYPGKAYHDTRFRRLCSDLLRLASDFLAYREYRRRPATHGLFLLHALANTRLEKHFKSTVRQLDNDLANTVYRDADFHYLNYMLHRRQHEHLEHVTGKSATLACLEKADYHLDCYYFSKKMEHFADALGYQDMTSKQIDIHLFPNMLKHLETTRFLNEPSVKAWYLVSLMMRQKEEHFFFQLKALLEKNGHNFQKKELQTLFIHLMNYCIDTKINNGHLEYYEELFSLYLTALAQEVIFDNQELNPHHYKNIVSVSLHLEKFDWVENFIQTYTARLPKESQENALNYNLARLYFKQAKYSQVIEQLREVEYQTPVYSLGSKLMLLQTYFEMDELMVLDSLIDSFRIYLRRHKLISKQVKQQYLNVLRFTKKLCNLAPYDKTAIEKTIVQIENCKNVAIKQWLLDKAREIGN